MQVFDVYLFSLDVQKSMHMYNFSDLRDFWTCTIVQDNFVSTGALKHVNVSRQAWPCFLLVVVPSVEFIDDMVTVLSKFYRCSIFSVEK
jgi:hypothetical protein